LKEDGDTDRKEEKKDQEECPPHLEHLSDY